MYLGVAYTWLSLDLAEFRFAFKLFTAYAEELFNSVDSLDIRDSAKILEILSHLIMTIGLRLKEFSWFFEGIVGDPDVMHPTLQLLS